MKINMALSFIENWMDVDKKSCEITNQTSDIKSHIHVNVD